MQIQTLRTPGLGDATPAFHMEDVPPAEWRAGHLPGSIHCHLPDLAVGLPEDLPADGEVWVACASGYRASIATGVLERAGRQPVVLTPGGIPDLLQRLSAQRRPAAA